MATVLQTLARDLGNILAENLKPGPRARDRVTLAVLLLFSGQSPRASYYRWNLLFRDFAHAEHDQTLPLPDGRTTTLPAEAIRYVDEVLWLRRLTLANNLKDRPSNIHLLFERNCQLNEDSATWSAAVVGRDPTAAGVDGDIPSATLNALKRQLQRLGDGYGDISKRRQAEFGRLWLSLHRGRAEVPEEMSVDDVVDASPLPLQDGFHKDKEFTKRLLRVIEALNERYMQLRACGLKPDEWLAQDRPSINQLAELRGLRLQAQRYEQEGLALHAAYERAFGEGLAANGGKKFGGFTGFEEFLQDAVGVEMMRLVASGHGSQERVSALADESEGEDPAQEIAFDDSPPASGDDDDGEEEQAYEEDFYPEEMDEEVDTQNVFCRLTELYPEQFSPIMRHYFCEVLALTGDVNGQIRAMNDPAFVGWLKNDDRFGKLSGPGLEDALFRQAEALIQQNAKKWKGFFEP